MDPEQTAGALQVGCICLIGHAGLMIQELCQLVEQVHLFSSDLAASSDTLTTPLLWTPAPPRGLPPPSAFCPTRFMGCIQ